MQKYEVGKPFPHPNIAPGQENCRAHIVGSSFDVYYFISGARKKEIRTFRDTLMRMYIYVEDHVPFIAVSYLGEPWSYDFTITAVGDYPGVAEAFLEPGNAVTFFLIDAKTNELLASRMIGLYPEAEKMIKDACREQIQAYSDRNEVGSVIQRVYSRMHGDDFMREGIMFEFKKR